MLAPEIHPAFGDITARLDRTFDGVSNVGRSLNAARSSGAVAPSDPITAPAPVAAPSSSIFRPSDFALPDFRAALGPSTEKTAARFTTVPQRRMDLGLPPAVATVVSELLAQLGPSAARDDDWCAPLTGMSDTVANFEVCTVAMCMVGCPSCANRMHCFNKARFKHASTTRERQQHWGGLNTSGRVSSARMSFGLLHLDLHRTEFSVCHHGSSGANIRAGSNAAKCGGPAAVAAAASGQYSASPVEATGGANQGSAEGRLP